MAYTIVQPSDFVGEIQIANKTQSDVSADLAYFITKYQAKFLKELLGYSFFAIFDAGMNADPQDARFVTLAAQLKPACANYIFYWYIRDQVTQTVGIGNVQTKGANSVTTDGGKKLSRSWNEMVKWVYEVIKYITDNSTIYPEYTEPNWLIWRMAQYQFDWWVQDYYLYPIGFNAYRIPDIFNSINDLNI
jgi:hypothetical protein